MSSLSLFEKPASAAAAPSGGWCPVAEARRFAGPEGSPRMVLADGVELCLGEAASFSDATNNNVAVFGASGSGKSVLLKANLARHQDGANLFVTDCKGDLYRATADAYRDDGYDVRLVDVRDLPGSRRFNPFCYMEDVSEIPGVVANLLDAVSPDRKRTVDSFWVYSSELLTCALVGALYALEAQNGDVSRGGERRYMTVGNLAKLVDLASASDYDESYVSPLDGFFDSLTSGYAEDPLEEGRVVAFDVPASHYAVRQYAAFCQAAGRTARSIIITLQAGLGHLQTPEMLDWLSGDELALDALDEGRRIVYLVTDENDETRDAIARLLFRTMFREAMLKADRNDGGALGKCLQIYADEFANIGFIDGFERSISTMRSRNIGIVMCLQSFAQLSRAYGSDGARIVLDCCSSLVFLGAGASVETAEYVARLCGETEAGTTLVGVERNRSTVFSRVANASWIAQMDHAKCIVKIAGCRPILADKVDYAALKADPNVNMG